MGRSRASWKVSLSRCLYGSSQQTTSGTDCIPDTCFGAHAYGKVPLGTLMALVRFGKAFTDRVPPGDRN